jgi:ribonuclease inhibitor
MKSLILWLEQLVGMSCWGIVAGAGTGSHLGIHFGGKIMRARPLDNPALDETVRAFQGELNMMVWCAWRLDHRDQMIGSWKQSNAVEGPMLAALRSLIGASVSAVSVHSPVHDLDLEFDHGVSLRLFCDQIGPQEGDNYVLYAADKSVAACGPAGAIETVECTEVDLRNVASSHEIHSRLKHALGFPDFYGMNWDAFWDAIVGLVRMPPWLVIRGFSEVNERFPRDAQLLCELLDQAEIHYLKR